MRTIIVLWTRQLKRHLRSKSRIIGSVGQPLLFLVALGFGFGPVYAKAGGGDYLSFLAPGIIGMSVLFTSIFSGVEVIWDKQFGFLKETMVAPVSRTAIMLGRTLGGATVAVFQGLIVLLLTLIVGFHPIGLFGVFIALVFMAMTAMLFTALGTALGARLEDMQGFQLIMNFLVMPTFFLSGALFPLAGLPGPLVLVTRLNPFAYGVDGIRGALTGSSHFGLGLDFLVLGVAISAALALGIALFRTMEV